MWANDSSKETLSMPFEKAFSDVQKADIWLNAYGKNLQEILAGESRVKLFPVWKTYRDEVSEVFHHRFSSVM